MEKRCINSKNYALTQDQPYEILNTEGSYVFVINDKGKTSKYHISLFEEEVIPPARTEQDCINSIVRVNQSNVTYIDLNNNTISIHGHLELNASNNFSCGVVRVAGLNDTISAIESGVNTDQEDLINLKKALLRELILAKLGTNTYGMWMCSTNQNTDHEDYYNQLNSMSTQQSGWFRNPNSTNQIQVWSTLINQ